MADDIARRTALKCMAFGAGTVFALSGGIPVSFPLAEAASPKHAGAKPLFVQISDSHIGFNKDANPDVDGTLARVAAVINDMPAQPAFILHTGDITHLSKPDEFDRARQILKGLRTSELHTTPGEHDVIDQGRVYFDGFGKESGGKGYYSFDSGGVHFAALINVLDFQQGGLGALGADQLAWLADDLSGRAASQPVVVFAHMPLWTIYAPWGWGTSDADAAFALLKRFGSVTVLNGHIHQIVQKVEGNMTFHTARSTAYPQPVAGTADAPGPLKVPPEKLAGMLGLTSVSLRRHAAAITLADRTLA
ncbi:MAG TPA: metallophosphoesterase [Rhizomicrobium sp.]|nr:metallophosphoesterase [Rhizomicrobium sp.]